MVVSKKLEGLDDSSNPEKFCLVMPLKQALNRLKSGMSGEFEDPQHIVKTFDKIISKT